MNPQIDPKTPKRTPFPAIAEQQAGIFTITQALDDGIGKRVVRTCQHSGRWIKVLGRGWTVADQQIGILQRCWAVSLTLPQVVIFGISALAVWHELDNNLMPSFPYNAEGPIWVASPTAQRKHPGVAILQIPAETCEDWPSRGLPLADPFESVTDALATAPEREADALFSWLVSRNRISLSEIDKGLERYRNRTGRPRLRRYRELCESGAASELEMRLHLLLRRAKLTGWVTNAKVRVDGRVVASADVLFEKAKLVVEVDGYGAHSSVEAFHSDRRRSRLLQSAGYRLLTFTWRDVVDTPSDTVAQISSFL
jgi:very-short-patch-repair endonuclease